MTQPGLRRILTTRDVVLFTVVAVFGLRNLAIAAQMGPGVVILWLLAVGAFFVPLGLAVVELGTRDPGEGGFYRWTRTAFGDAHGFLAGWFYWVSNLTYFPLLLTFIAACAAYGFHRPDLAENSWFVGGIALALLWLAAWANVLGLELGRWITNVGGSAAWVVGGLLIAASALSGVRHGSATGWNWDSMVVGLEDWRTFGYLGTLAFALGGLELIAIMGGEVREPQRTLPRAILLAGLICGCLYVAGTAAVLMALPAKNVSVIGGVLDALQAIADRDGWDFLPVVGAALAVISATATLYAYLGGVARLPLAAGLDHFVPPVLGRIHPRYGTPHVAILVQAGVASLFIVASHLGATVREAYLVVVDMTTVLTFLPYLYIFLSVPRLRLTGSEPGVVRIPGGRAGVWYVALAGGATTALSIATSLIPPSEVKNVALFEAKLLGGLAIFAAGGYVLYRRSAGRGTLDQRREGQGDGGALPPMR